MIQKIKDQTLIWGNGLEVMKEMKGQQFKACITDPPYGIAFDEEKIKNTIRTSGRNRVITAEWDKFETLNEFQDFTKKWLKLLYRIMSLKSNVFMFFSYTHREWIIQCIKEAGFNFRKPLIFYKPDTMACFPNNFGNNYEDIYWFTKNEDSVEEKYYIKIPNNMRDVFVFNSTNNTYRKECDYHPTAKPLKMIEQLIGVCTEEGDTVIDPFVGSGTTLVACQRTNRIGTGIELNPQYVETTKKRILNVPKGLKEFTQC